MIKSCIDREALKSIIHLLSIKQLEFFIKCISYTEDDILIKYLIRDKKIEKILEN